MKFTYLTIFLIVCTFNVFGNCDDLYRILNKQDKKRERLANYAPFFSGSIEATNIELVSTAKQILKSLDIDYKVTGVKGESLVIDMASQSNSEIFKKYQRIAGYLNTETLFYSPSELLHSQGYFYTDARFELGKSLFDDLVQGNLGAQTKHVLRHALLELKARRSIRGNIYDAIYTSDLMVGKPYFGGLLNSEVSYTFGMGLRDELAELIKSWDRFGVSSRYKSFKSLKKKIKSLNRINSTLLTLTQRDLNILNRQVYGHLEKLSFTSAYNIEIQHTYMKKTYMNLPKGYEVNSNMGEEDFNRVMEYLIAKQQKLNSIVNNQMAIVNSIKAHVDNLYSGSKTSLSNLKELSLELSLNLINH